MAIYAGKKKQNRIDQSKAVKEPSSQLEQAFIDQIAESISIDKQTLITRFPFTGSMIMRLEVIVGVWDDIPTACTNGEKIWVNALFYSTLNENEKLFVLAHECWHVILRHFLRKMNRKQDLWNWATDLEIHFLLTKEGFTAPFVLPHSKSWSDMSFEQIYEELLKSEKEAMEEMKKNSNSGNGGDSKKQMRDSNGNKLTDQKASDKFSGNSIGQSFDVHDQNVCPEKIEDETEAQNAIKNKIIAAANIAKRRFEMTGKNRGLLPGYITQLLDNLPNISKLPWRTLLKQFLTNSSMRSHRRWIPPNRRYVYQNIYRQSSNSNDKFRGVVAIDTSGSCIEVVPRFFSEFIALLKTFGDFEIDLIQCDATVGDVQHYTSENFDINAIKRNLKVVGGGGTSHIPVFEYIRKHISDPNCLICLTDGETDFPKYVPNYPVMWAIPKFGQYSIPKMPFGMTVAIDE